MNIAAGHWVRTNVAQLFNVRRHEVRSVAWAICFFFCLLTALMVVRPARDALGTAGGIDQVRWLFMGTAVVTLLVNPVYGWLVSRMRRIRFTAVCYLFFAASLVAFHLLLQGAPGKIGVASGQVFYVWFSVFNLFSTMLFWAIMVDHYSFEQGKRLFGLVAVGGTLGAIFGPWLASRLAQPLGTSSLLLISAGFLVFALFAAWQVVRRVSSTRSPDSKSACCRSQTHGDHAQELEIIGGSAWHGFKALMHSPYLLGIAAYVIIMTIMGTFLYFTRLHMVVALGDDTDLRATLFGRIDFYTQVATLILQSVVTGRLMKRLGVHIPLMLLPIVVTFGFWGVVVASSLAVLIVFEAAFRAVQRAITRPVRETLYSVVSREDKYKSKGFIDTFGYRGGDVIGAQLEGLLGRLGMGLAGLASLVIPLAIVWAGLAWWLARTQARLYTVSTGD